MPFFSIIIPLIKINKYLKNNLYEIYKQNFADFEVLVVTDEKNEINENEFNYENLTFINSGPVGPAIKRDLASKLSKGNYLIFFDDDSFPSNEYLINAYNILLKNNYDVIVGSAITPTKQNLIQTLSGNFFASSFGGGFKERYQVNKKSKNKTFNEWPSVNFIIRKETFLSVGGFNLDIWPGEDTYLCLKLRNRDTKIYYHPEIFVYHERRSTFLKHLKQIYGYGSMRAEMLSKTKNNNDDIKYYLPPIFFITNLILIIYSIVKMDFSYYLLFFIFYILTILYSFLNQIRDINFYIFLLNPIFFYISHFVYGVSFTIKKIINIFNGK